MITESQRSELMAHVLRKEYLARLCEQGRISSEEYLRSVNIIRAAEDLPPLTLADAPGLPRRVVRSRRPKRVSR